MARSGIARHHIAAVACGGDYRLRRGADIGAYGNMWNVVLSIHRVPVQQRIHHRAGRHLALVSSDKINRRAELARMNVQDL